MEMTDDMMKKCRVCPICRRRPELERGHNMAPYEPYRIGCSTCRLWTSGKNPEHAMERWNRLLDRLTDLADERKSWRNDDDR